MIDAGETHDHDAGSMLLLLPKAGMNASKHLERAHHLLVSELELLARIRYKQKNQHKAALWWKHVAGVQRIGKRFVREVETDLIKSLKQSK